MKKSPEATQRPHAVPVDDRISHPLNFSRGSEKVRALTPTMAGFLRPLNAERGECERFRRSDDDTR